jgi:TldD protein
MRLDLESYASELKDYTELRAHRNASTSIRFVNGNLVENSRTESSGCSARVYKNGFWGFASSPEADAKSIRSVLSHASDNADFLASRGNRKAEKLAVSSSRIEKDFATKKPRLSQKQLVEFLKNLDSYIQQKFPKLKGRRLNIYNLDMEKSLRTSQGGRIYSLTPRSHVGIFLTGERNGTPVDINESFGGRGQFEDVFEKPDWLFREADKLHEKLVQKCEGIYSEAGVHDVILAPDLAGILAHEAIGHTTEADIVLGGSVAAENLGKVVASPLISLVDYAHEVDGEVAPVPVYADDEGTPAEDCVIIENGVLKSFMHSKETAAHFGVKPTGNARAFEFSDEPLIRMRNTAILPGKSKLADMIASIEHGYLLSHPGNGQADSTGEFMFAVRMGWEIRNGKLGKAIQDTTISGVAFDMLKTVSMVSDDMLWLSGGFCGKKQPMSVGMGGPAIKCRVALGGR